MLIRKNRDHSRPRATVRELALLADEVRLTGDKERCEALIQQILDAYAYASAHDPDAHKNF